MAQRVQVLLVCDVHDDDDTPGTETIPFSLDGTNYEIDLCDDHAAELRDAVAPFIGAGRRVGGARGARRTGSTGRSGRTSSSSPSSARQQAGDIRAWARGRGLAVNDRGRIPAHIVEQYNAAH